MDEVPLAGGSVAATVVRVSDTVWRSTDRWSPAVHQLLEHLEAAGFAGAQRFLGIDDKGRETLSWLDGLPATRPWPNALLADDGVRRYLMTDIERTSRLGPLGVTPWDMFYRRGNHERGAALLDWLRTNRHLAE